MSKFNLEDDEPRIQGALSKAELAQLYKVSSSTFSKWLNEGLTEELAATGYTKDQKILSPRQIEIVFAKYGKP